MFKTELFEVGDTLGVVLPDELLSRLNLNVGDTLDMTETADSIMLSKAAPEIDSPMLGIDQNKK